MQSAFHIVDARERENVHAPHHGNVTKPWGGLPDAGRWIEDPVRNSPGGGKVQIYWRAMCQSPTPRMAKTEGPAAVSDCGVFCYEDRGARMELRRLRLLARLAGQLLGLASTPLSLGSNLRFSSGGQQESPRSGDSTPRAFNRGARTRTGDLRLPKPTRYRTAPRPVLFPDPSLLHFARRSRVAPHSVRWSRVAAETCFPTISAARLS